MSKSVLSEQQYQYSGQGYLVDNAPWQEELKRRAEEEMNRRLALLAPPVLGEGSPAPKGFLLESFGLENPELPESPAPELEAAPSPEEALVQARETAEAQARLIEEEARRKAAEVEAEAQKRAEQMIVQAKSDAEAKAQGIQREAREAGEKEGHEQGYQSGFEKGRAEGAETYSTRVKEMASVLQSATEERKRLLGEMQPLLVDLVGDALYECLKKKGKSGNTVVHFVEEALKKAGDRVQLKVHLNPSDVETVESEIQNLQLSVGAGEIELVPDARIEQGGCLLVTEAGSVDVRLPTVVAQVKDALRSEG